jgi:hypothetical protein
MDPGTFLGIIAYAAFAALVLVVGRLLWCLAVSIRARRYKIMIVSLAGLLLMLLVLSTVVVVWFGYGVAHTGKSARNDMIVLFSTVPPYFLVSIGLWILGGKLLSRLRPDATKKGDQ